MQQPLNQAQVASYESINKINIEIQSTGGMHESKWARCMHSKQQQIKEKWFLQNKKFAGKVWKGILNYYV